MDSNDENIVKIATFRKMARDAEKRAAKAEKEKRATANRTRFGRSGAEKKRDKLERTRAERKLDGARRDTPPDDPTASE
ncbi:DUF4169 family protein [Parvibaculum sp.]|uniref:DUF4169 family protein n=1 Tax=Parvibaculum sp. TaxID=2024848 RepID=UPI00272AF294|nr:DUF4169 family protein [Parvibaculum sp.]